MLAEVLRVGAWWSMRVCGDKIHRREVETGNLLCHAVSQGAPFGAY